MNRFLLVALLALSVVVFGAAKPTPAPVGMNLMFSHHYDPNPNLPLDEPGCIHEDTIYQRRWQGTLPAAGAFEVPLRLCDYYRADTGLACSTPVTTTECPFGGPGGAGVRYTVFFYSTHPVEAFLVRPDGTIHRPHLMESVVVGKGSKKRIQYKWTGCIFPTAYLSADNLTDPVPPGIYTVKLNNPGGTIAEEDTLNFYVAGEQGYRIVQELCPVEDQRILP